jgi:hypothetical protein
MAAKFELCAGKTFKVLAFYVLAYICIYIYIYTRSSAHTLFLDVKCLILHVSVFRKLVLSIKSDIIIYVIWNMSVQKPR